MFIYLSYKLVSHLVQIGLDLQFQIRPQILVFGHHILDQQEIIVLGL